MGLETELADDMLPSAEAIGDFIFGAGGDRKKKLRKTYYLLERKYVRAGKLGSNWIGSKRTIREDYERLTRGEVAV